MNIGILCREGERHFIEPYIAGLQEMTNIRICNNEVEEEIGDLINWSDIIIIEWAHKFAKIYSNLRIEPFRKPYVIVRCLNGEMASLNFKEICWDNIDCVWFINKQTQEDFLKRVKPKDYFYLPNAIDPSKFPFIKKAYGKNIVMYSLDYRPRKNYVNALHFFKKLLEYDDEFRLFIKAMPKPTEFFDLFIKTIKELKLEDYVALNLSEINLSKLDDKSDLIEYLADKDLFLSYSTHEAFHYALAESMLLGLKGFCRRWEWGNPQDFWKPFVFDDDNDLIRAIVFFSKLSQSPRLGICKADRLYVIENFGHKKLVKELLEIIEKRR